MLKTVPGETTGASLVSAASAEMFVDVNALLAFVLEYRVFGQRNPVYQGGCLVDAIGDVDLQRRPVVVLVADAQDRPKEAAHDVLADTCTVSMSLESNPSAKPRP
jgi:hypothetical protein